MRNFVSLARFEVVLFGCLALMVTSDELRAGKDATCVAPTPALPQEWIFLEDKPRLWREPAGKSRMPELSAKALDGVLALERREAGDPAAAWLRVRWTDGGGNAIEGWLPEAMLASKPLVSAAALNDLGEEPVDRVHGIPPDYEPPDLVVVQHGFEKERVYKLRREAAEALEQLVGAARSEGLTLAVVSAYRSHETQRGVYSRKIKAAGWNQTTVAKPGHSEHQLGTAVDFTDGDHTVLLQEAFGDTPAGKWLLANAPKFGFAVSYTKANQAATGYSPEPWHYRYYGVSLAKKKHREALGGQ